MGLVLLGAFGLTLGRIKEPQCARCKYPVLGLRGTTCPECANDLRGFGTRPPGARMIVRPPFGVVVFCRVVLVVIPTALLLQASMNWIERDESFAEGTASSRCGLFERIVVRGRGSVTRTASRTRNSYHLPRRNCAAELKGPRRVVRLEVTDTLLRVRYQSGDGAWVKTSCAFDVEDVLAWMSASGVATAHECARQEAQAIHMLITNVAVGGGSVEEPWTGPMAFLTHARINAERSLGPAGWPELSILGVSAVALYVLLGPMLRRSVPDSSNSSRTPPAGE